jgi:hypothetical protein
LASESRSARRVKGLAAILRQEVRAVQVGDWQGHYLTDVLYIQCDRQIQYAFAGCMVDSIRNRWCDRYGRNADTHSALRPALAGFLPTSEFPDIAEAVGFVAAVKAAGE